MFGSSSLPGSIRQVKISTQASPFDEPTEIQSLKQYHSLSSVPDPQTHKDNINLVDDSIAVDSPDQLPPSINTKSKSPNNAESSIPNFSPLSAKQLKFKKLFDSDNIDLGMNKIA
eukprot:TRINITY_DN20376_c0_g1_i1.p1 TRINITY_DN20376_c0_g1~~TRINITY_DN20376_c0_g1_i1.p1  ORF type:complete len:115 (+),score=24.46 TRINITY_DN20376_c0_g1_i1:104-448(+)